MTSDFRRNGYDRIDFHRSRRVLRYAVRFHAGRVRRLYVVRSRILRVFFVQALRNRTYQRVRIDSDFRRLNPRMTLTCVFGYRLIHSVGVDDFNKGTFGEIRRKSFERGIHAFYEVRGNRVRDTPAVAR